MRDGFLWFLMGLAGVIVTGYLVLLITVTRRDTGDGGCLLLVALVLAACIVCAILGTVGHAVGVSGG